jgi:hypothetical protein
LLNLFHFYLLGKMHLMCAGDLEQSACQAKTRVIYAVWGYFPDDLRQRVTKFVT